MEKSAAKQIDRLRSAGMKPTAIAERLGLSVNTVKSHSRRHSAAPDSPLCLYCGRPVPQNEGRKTKKYCSDKCRIGYWNHIYRSKEKKDGDKR